MKQKIIFTGAQGTGKTTILNLFKNDGKNVITEVVRNLAKEGVKINDEGDLEGQKAIFNEYFKLLNETEEYFSDRGLTDVIAYTMYLTNHCRGKKKRQELLNLLEEQITQLYIFYHDHPDVLYCYFPIEFKVVADGVRSTKPKFRKEIDENIKMVLEMMEVNYLTVTGTVEERYNYILENL